MSYSLTHLRELEAESIFIMREVAAQFQNPALLFSGGKDSIVMVYLARKAFFPAKFPFPLVHIDTGHNFPETMEYRDWLVNEMGARLIVGSVEDSISKGTAVEEKGINASRNALQTVTLLETVEQNKFDAAMGGARRDEEKARAKERIFSVRDEFGQWNPKLQRPELWNILNGRISKGENVRVFPISNWTEIDVWNYIREENIPLPSIYFAHEREVIEHDGQLIAVSPFITLEDSDKRLLKKVRYRTVGDMTCTAAVESYAATLDTVIAEILSSKISERGETRIDDKQTEAAMEDRKINGYF